MTSKVSNVNSYVRKKKTEDSLPLDIRKLQSTGLLIPGRSITLEWSVKGKPIASIRTNVEIDHVVLVYRYRGRGNSEWEDVEQKVYIDLTPCTYGGTRPWWLCPYCNRRVAILYSTSKYYACRHCCNLTYTSQMENVADRSARKANKIRKRLGWPTGIFNPIGIKPKGMRSTTYWKLRSQYCKHAEITLSILKRRIRTMNNLRTEKLCHARPRK